MFEQIQKLKKQFAADVREIKDAVSLELLEQKFFSRQNGILTGAMKEISSIAVDKKKAYGEAMNELKKELTDIVARKRTEFAAARWEKIAEEEKIDVTQPFIGQKKVGTVHPVSQVQSDLEDLFTSMGFMVLDGPELESDYYNFEALNIPADHPARDMQDTFYIKGHSNWVMRTHTSPLQVRAVEKYGAPIRAIVPGRCFRNEATDARHEHTFYQLDGIMIDKNITLAHMKSVLESVAKHLYGPETAVRLRPKFYPFVEPGVNGEVTCFLCHGAGCRVCKNTGWLEIFGAGMMHPNVLRAGKVDPEKYSGFAFGFGLTRLVMLKYQIEDIRLMQSGDLRFLNQF